GADRGVAVDVALRDVPVVDAGVARRVGVGERDPLLQLRRRDVDRHAADAVDAELDGRDAAVVRRAIVLRAGRHLDRLRVAVHRNLEDPVGRPVAAAPGVERAADGDVERRRARDAGAHRRFRSGRQLEPFRPEEMEQLAEQPEVVRVAQLRPVIRFDALAGILGDEHQPPIRSRPQVAARAQADRGVERLRSFVKEVQRPDVERAAREIDARRRGCVDVHGEIIPCPPVGDRQSARMRHMSLRDLRRHVGQLAIAGFAGTDVPADLRSLAREFDLGGVIFFSRNVESPEQIADLSRQSQALSSGIPLWVSVDQEGGRVARLKRPFTEWPPMITLRRAGSPESDRLAARFATALAAELHAVGISLDYTPVLDVHTNPKNPVIGDRALAARAEDVARLGTIIIRTLQDAGIAACGKHFPGHGDTSTDSHHELPLLEHAPDRLDAVELVPFKAAIAAGVASIMTAHILIPSLDEERPGTLSPAIVDGLLKRKLGYGGLVLSDDLEMKAISGRYGHADATVRAIAAGCDAVLMCAPKPDEQMAALEAIIYAVEEGRLPLARVEDALKRHRLREERFPPAPRRAPPAGRAPPARPPPGGRPA